MRRRQNNQGQLIQFTTAGSSMITLDEKAVLTEFDNWVRS
jgi:hypothetical protein